MSQLACTHYAYLRQLETVERFFNGDSSVTLVTNTCCSFHCNDVLSALPTDDYL